MKYESYDTNKKTAKQIAKSQSIDFNISKSHRIEKLVKILSHLSLLIHLQKRNTLKYILILHVSMII